MKPFVVHHLESVDYERRTGGWIYNNRLIDCLQKAGCEVKRLILPPFFDASDDEIEANLEALLAGLPKGSIIVADNLYLMRFARQMKQRGLADRFDLPSPYFRRTVDRRRLGIGAGTAGFGRSEPCGLHLQPHRPTASSRSMALTVARSSSRCRVSTHASRHRQHVEGDWRFLSVGAVVPRKRYEFIIDALAAVPDRNWQWTVVGNVTRYPTYVAELRGAVRRHGLDRNIVFAGEVEEPELERLWREAHIFLMSSTHEGYGMAVAEALAHGVPTITTMAGAVADWASDAVILVRSDDPAEMAAQHCRHPERQIKLSCGAEPGTVFRKNTSELG